MHIKYLSSGQVNVEKHPLLEDMNLNYSHERQLAKTSLEGIWVCSKWLFIYYSAKTKTVTMVFVKGLFISMEWFLIMCCTDCCAVNNCLQFLQHPRCRRKTKLIIRRAITLTRC